MSLVNDMLRDLDQRRSAGGPQVDLQQVSAAQHPSDKKSVRAWQVVLLLLVMLAVVGYLRWPLLSSLLDRFQGPAPAVVLPDSPTDLSVADRPSADSPALVVPGMNSSSNAGPATAPVTIGQVSWQSSEEGLKWVLHTDRQPTFEVQQQQSRRLQLLLPQARLTAVLPSLPLRLVQSANVAQQETGLVLSLSTDQHSRFQVYPLTGNAGSGLVIELSAQKRPQSPAQAPSIESKQPLPSAIAMVGAPSAAVMGAVEEKIEAKVEAKVEAKAALKGTSPSTQQSAAKARATQPLVKTAKPLSSAEIDRQQARDAAALVGQGRQAEAEQRLRMTLEQHAGAVESRQLLASLLLSSGRMKQADQLLSQGLELEPTHLGLRKIRARILLHSAKADEALRLLQPALPALLSDPDYHQLRATALQQAGQHEAATELYQQLLKIDSTQAAWWLGLAISLEARQQSSLAQQAYRNVLQIPGASTTLTDYARRRMR